MTMPPRNSQSSADDARRQGCDFGHLDWGESAPENGEATFLAGPRRIRCNIELRSEQEPNPYIDRWIEFRHFFVRKLMLVKCICGFVIMPGGYSPLDEAFETVTLIQTRKIADFPILLMAADYWEPLQGCVRESLLRRGAIHEVDLQRLVVTDDVEAVVACLVSCARRCFDIDLLDNRSAHTW